MQVHAIGNGAYAAYVSGEELKIRNIPIEDITHVERKRLLELFPAEAGNTAGRRATLEIFPGREGVLLFLRYCLEKPVFFSFCSLDALLEAVSECREDMPARLDSFDGVYILTLYPRGENEADGFGEFGVRLPYPDGFSAHMREHGKTLIEADALAILHRAFRV